MTDKQIIIDGINVSRCEYRDWRNSCHCDNSKENEGEKRVTGRGGCKYNPNCYYKQLKRKEEECEELKQTLTEIKEIAKKAKKDICNNCGWRNTDSCDPEDYTCREFIKILQKISEVEEQC